MKRFGVWAPAIIFGAALFLSNPVNAAGCTFASTEATNSFNVAANWSCGHVPVGADNVTIPAATTTFMLGGPVTVSVVNISGTLNIGSQFLTATSTFFVNVGGVATSTSGTLNMSGGGTTTNSGSMGTNSGNFMFTGNVQNNGTFDIGAGNVTSTSASTFTNAGTINGGTGVLAIGVGFVDVGGTFNVQSGTVRTFRDGYIWVAKQSTNNVSKIDPTTNSVDATVTVGSLPRHIAFFDSHVWAVNFSSNSVSKIDPATNAVVATTVVGGNPRGIGFDGSHIWVANFTTNNLSKIDTITNAVVATTTLSSGAQPFGIAFDGSFIWVANVGLGSVSKINTTTNAVVATTTVGTTPTGVTFAAGFIWVVNFSSNSVSKIDPATNAVVATTTVGSSPSSMAFDGTYLWVTNGAAAGTVSKIDSTTNLVVATVAVGTNPEGITFDGRHIWVANITSSNLSKIDITTNAVVATTTASSGSYDVTFSGPVTPRTITLPSHIYSSLHVFNNLTDTVSFSASSTVLGTLALSGFGKLSAAALTINVLGTATVESGTTVTSTSGGFNFSSVVTSTGSIGSDTGNTVFNSTLQNNGTFQVGSGSATTTGALTNSASGLVKVGAGRLAAIGLITNTGTISETTGKIVHTAESVKLTDSSGVEASSYSTATGAPAPVVYVTIQDSNRNLLGSTIETMTVLVTLDATAGSDSETMTLTETSASSGIFRNLAALTIIPATAISTPENGQFELVATGTGTSTYTDNQDASDIGTDTITFTKTAAASSSGSGGSGSGGGGGAATDPNTSGIGPHGFATTTPSNPPPTTPTETPSETGIQPPVTASEFIDPGDLPLLLATYNFVPNSPLQPACLTQIRSDAKSFGLTLTSAQESAMCNFIVYGNSTASIKFGSGERRAILRDYFDTMRRSDVVWSDIERMATGKIMIVRNLSEEQKRVGKVLSAFLKIFGHVPNSNDTNESLSWNTLQYRIRFPRNITLESKGIQSYQAIFLVNPATPFEWSVVRVLGYVK